MKERPLQILLVEDTDGHIDDLAAQVAMYSRMSSGPSWSVERWKYCANYTPMSSEHGCERLSHDQPIVFSRELLD